MILVVIPHCSRRRAARIRIDGFLVLFGEGQPGLPDPRPDCHRVAVPLLSQVRRADHLLHALLDDLLTLLWGRVLGGWTRVAVDGKYYLKKDNIMQLIWKMYRSLQSGQNNGG